MAKTKTADTRALAGALQKEPSRIEPGMTLASLLKTDTIRTRFSEVLGSKAPAFASSILSAVAANQSLKACDPMSVISSAMIAATLDLPVNPALGLAHIVPYKDKATFQIGWKGIYQLAMRSGQYLTINIATVFEGELISRNRFTGEMKFDPEGKKSEKVLGYLLYFKLLNGFEKHYYMTHEEAEAHGKRYSQSYKKGFGVWADNFEAMAHKTVAKLGLSKFGVLSVEMAKAFEADQSIVDEAGSPAAYPDAAPVGDGTSEAAPSVDQPASSDAPAGGEIAGEGEEF